MEKKQTAVQWLQTLYNNIDEPLTDEDFKQALQMERDQIEQAWIDGSHNGSVLGASDYYRQTFNK